MKHEYIATLYCHCVFSNYQTFKTTDAPRWRYRDRCAKMTLQREVCQNATTETDVSRWHCRERCAKMTPWQSRYFIFYEFIYVFKCSVFYLLCLLTIIMSKLDRCKCLLQIFSIENNWLKVWFCAERAAMCLLLRFQWLHHPKIETSSCPRFAVIDRYQMTSRNATDKWPSTDQLKLTNENC